MGIQRSQEDAWTKEMAKWEHRPVLVNGTYIEPIPIEHGGKKDAPFQAYPKMLYRAELADGGYRIAEFEIVKDEAGERIACGQGYAPTQEQALAQAEARQLEIAKLAANRVANERWMSDKAKAEAQAVDESTVNHLPEIPETPIKRRGRPKKDTPVPA